MSGRLTGEFILEVNTDASRLLDFVRAARRYGETDVEDSGLYTVVVGTQATEVAKYRMRTLLVYNDAGDLLRDHSLIPGGVEL